MNSALKVWVWKWIVRRLRAAVWAADEWIHAQELKLSAQRDGGRQPVAPPAEFDRKASAAREKAHKRAARAARPRLIYQGGQFVRKEARQ